MFNIRPLFRSTFVYTLLGFLPMASAFVLTPVYTKFLTTEEYGIISLSNVFQSYLAIFVAIGIDSAFTRFYFKYNLFAEFFFYPFQHRYDRNEVLNSMRAPCPSDTNFFCVGFFFLPGISICIYSAGDDNNIFIELQCVISQKTVAGKNEIR